MKIAWRNGVLTEAMIHLLNGNPVKVRYETQTRDVTLVKGPCCRSQAPPQWIHWPPKNAESAKKLNR